MKEPKKVYPWEVSHEEYEEYRAQRRQSANDDIVNTREWFSTFRGFMFVVLMLLVVASVAGMIFGFGILWLLVGAGVALAFILISIPAEIAKIEEHSEEWWDHRP